VTVRGSRSVVPHQGAEEGKRPIAKALKESFLGDENVYILIVVRGHNCV
jgi:hypothetical protein